MKWVYRIIGFAVVLIVLVAALLYFLNEKGVLKGPVSEWVTSVKNSIMDIFHASSKMKEDLSNSDHPLDESIDRETLKDGVNDIVHETIEDVKDAGKIVKDSIDIP
jgi:hypothetical protein